MSDTSPIRALHHLGLLHVLATLFSEVVVPAVVVSELDAQTRFARIDLPSVPFLKIRTPGSKQDVAQLERELDPGEAAAIALAVELHADWLLIDERHGRRVATSRGLQTTGALGVLVRAKIRGLIPEVRTLACKLRDDLGFHLTEALIDEACRLAGES